jgi:hypothetical protein
MKNLFIIIVLVFLLLPVASYGADIIYKGSVMPYDGICMQDANAHNLVEYLETSKVEKKEMGLMVERVQYLEEINDSLKKQRDTYKNGYDAMKKMVDDQIDLTKQTTEQCKEIVNHSKPTLMQDAGKVGIGVLLGIAIALLL